MKRPFLLVVAFALLASCSQNEVVECQSVKISFSANQSNVMRTTVYDNNNLPEQFKVFAVHNLNGQVDDYFYCTVARVAGTTTYKPTDGDRYWPAAGTVTFYAHAYAEPANLDDANVESLDLQFGFENLQTTTGVEQSDFIYAVATDCTQATAGGKVQLVFKHALSQIAFQAVNRNKNINVVINSITFKELAGKGEFAFPLVATNDAATALPCTWSTLTNELDWLGFDPALYNEGNTYSVPYKTDGFDPIFVDNLRMIPQAKTGGKIVLNCSIVSSENTNIVIHEGDYELTCDINWAAGYRYTYKLVFGAAGTGDTDGIIKPIIFDIEVDDYTDATSEEHNI